jgi:hypothetical protein
LSSENSYMVFEIGKCTLGPDLCATQSELDSYFNTYGIIGVTATSFLDFNDFSGDPIKTQIDYTFTD